METWIVILFALLWLSTGTQSKNVCERSSKHKERIRGFFEQNIDLVCPTSRTCNRVLWKRQFTGGNTEEIPEQCVDCPYNVSNNEVNATYILHIYNLSDSVEGVYSCHCQWMIPHSSKTTMFTEGCFSLSLDTLECEMETRINGQNALTYIGNHLERNVQNVNANVNDVLNVNCLNSATKDTNCSELEHSLYKTYLRPSDTWCYFSCTATEGTATCQVGIILNVTIESFQPGTTSMSDFFKTSMSSYPTMDSATGAYQGIVTTDEVSTNHLPSGDHSKDIFSTVTLFSEDERSTTKQLQTKSSNDILVSTLEEQITTESKLTKIFRQSLLRDRIVISFLISLILMSIIIMLQTVYIISTKKCCSLLSSKKEKWINPIYNISMRNRAIPYAETEIPGIRMCNRNRWDQSLPRLDTVRIQERRQFHSLDSLDKVNEKDDPRWFTKKYKNGKVVNGPVGRLISHENEIPSNNLHSQIDTKENIADIKTENFPSEKENRSPPNSMIKARKERFTSLHIYEDAKFGSTS